MSSRLSGALQGMTLAVLIVAFVYFAVVTTQQNVVLSHQSQASVRTEHALCILRDDLQARVAASMAFLRSHPHGIAGISSQAIQQSIDSQQRTINALQLLECNRWTN